MCVSNLYLLLFLEFILFSIHISIDFYSVLDKKHEKNYYCYLKKIRPLEREWLVFIGFCYYRVLGLFFPLLFSHYNDTHMNSAIFSANIFLHTHTHTYTYAHLLQGSKDVFGLVYLWC
jgi:hypothetical protein